ncbi:MAG TPA: ParB/RepB/Spo0J family partition protein [Candidatus Cloacimonadota bacterium]|nr:ParB/RepB/Spo0J family partition protein [Candidatus Cloacimonadota bacterium]
MSKLATLKLDQIVESPVALRSVNEESEQFQEIAESIKAKGIVNPISVRELRDGENAGKFCIVDGLHRYTGAKRAGLIEIPVQILDVSEAEALETQIVANIQKVDTKPVEYAKGLKRMLSVYPLMTVADLAQKICKSTAWISERFGLLTLPKEVQDSVDSGEIKLGNAYALSKLPEGEIAAFLDRAMTLPPVEFVPLVESRKKELDKARREGKDGQPEEFVAIPVMRKPAEIKGEYESPAIGAKLCKEENAGTPADGFALAIRWVLKMDKAAIAESLAKYEARKKALAEAKERRIKETVQKKYENAEAKIAKLQKEAEQAKKDAASVGIKIA